MFTHELKQGDCTIRISSVSIIRRESTDERNFVKKAVNWALRQIGKRNQRLRKQAVITATQIYKLDSKSAKWISSDALRELTNRKFTEPK